MGDISTSLVLADKTNSSEQENQCIRITSFMMEHEKQDESKKSSKLSHDLEVVDKQQNTGFHNPSVVMSDDSNSLISKLGRDISISCLLRLSRSEYGLIASLNKSYRSLIRTGELYQIRQKMGIVEHWLYFSCDVQRWEAFDPNRRRWFDLPSIAFDQCFTCSDKESLAVGTELLVFGRGPWTQVIYSYSHLTNTWSDGTLMNIPRYLFGSASLGGIAIVAGGCDKKGNILSVAELYDSNTKKWEILPSMHRPRKICSGVFMDGKFYVLGGIGEDPKKLLTCGEEYDLRTRTWRVIPNMFPPQSREGAVADKRDTAEAPPLVAVASNELYAADYERWELRRYVKETNKWVTIGSLPEGSSSVNGWGLAFRACGDQLFFLGGPNALSVTATDINSWVPGEDAPQWNVLARRQSMGFVYNCAVMGC
ncbi:hypothetical protein Fmac_026350 [Flemingia macrophylla]|uniref:F-box/kelch-repeat protein n=1 Tax=Flemingia macrophylla TaxID=520843 RepID=A0ABD1LEL3_9FABA